MSSVTGVMWNIRVFTASVCTDECPPHETREALSRRYDSFRHIRMFISSGHYVRSEACSGPNATEKCYVLSRVTPV